MTKSLQARLLLGLAISTALVLIASGVVLYLLIRAALIAGFDSALASDAHALATLVEEQDGRFQTEMAEHGVEHYQPDDHPLYYQLWQSDGTMIERSTALGSGDLPRSAGNAGQIFYQFVMLPNQRPCRMIGIRFAPHHLKSVANSNADSTKGEVTLVVARETHEFNQTLVWIKLVLVAVLACAMSLLMAISAPVVHAGLRPLRTTANLIEKMDGRSLGERLDVSNAPPEIAPLIERLNDLLNRLHAAFQRERAFSANVAHELRTPLAGLRTTIEVALTAPREPGDYQRSLATCLDIAKQTQGIVENLLSLARLDAGAYKVQSAIFQLDPLVQNAWIPFAPRAARRRVTVKWAVDPAIVVKSDPDVLKLLLTNLFDNAISHGEVAGTIEIRANVCESNCKLSVTNSGSRISQQQAADASERFWRGDSSRSNTGTHAGLGLALCREFSQLLNLSMDVKSQVGGMFEVDIRIPIVPRNSVEQKAALASR